jgi:hypothetical protein
MGEKVARGQAQAGSGRKGQAIDIERARLVLPLVSQLLGLKWEEGGTDERRN